jgi:hypothetical protein
MPTAEKVSEGLAKVKYDPFQGKSNKAKDNRSLHLSKAKNAKKIRFSL